MDIDRKKHLFGRCASGTGKYKTGTVTGAYVGFEDFDDSKSPTLSITLKNCRAI